MTLLPLLLLAGCKIASNVDPNGLSFLQVKLVSTPPGTEAAPASFTSEGTTVTLSVQTLDRDAQPMSLSTKMSVSARPGSVTSDATIDLVDGAWTGDVTVKNGFGDTRIWINDDIAGYEGRSPTWISGVSDALWFMDPTIAEMQATTDHETNNLEKEFVDLRIADRQVVLTAIATDGFWAADITDGNGIYNGLYVYTFNKPDYELNEGSEDSTVAVGDRLEALTGIDQEYLATTQFSFPTYARMADETLTAPDPVEITTDIGCNDDEMEKLEALPVWIPNALIPSDFTDQATTEDYQDYVDYGQWPIDFGECTLYAESTTTVPDFLPTEHPGETLTYVQGMLSEVYGKWIVVVRDADDLSYAARSPRARTRRAAQLPHRPLPRHP